MFKTITRKAMTVLSSLALLVAVQSVSEICFWCFHQPDVPAGLKKYEK